MENENVSLILENSTISGHHPEDNLESGTNVVELVVSGSILSVISLVSMFGNALVMAAVYTNHNLRTTSNYLLVNLALADFLQGGISIPMRIVEILHPACNLRVFCRASIFFSTLFGGNSNFSIIFISIERFTAVLWPFFHHNRITVNTVLRGVVLSWISITVFALLPILGVGRIEPSSAIEFCRFPFFLSPTYYLALFFLIFIIPIVVVTPLYAFILKASMKNIRQIHAQERSVRFCESEMHTVIAGTESPIFKRKQHLSKSVRQRKSAKIVTRLIGVFIILYLPIFLIDIVNMFGGPSAPLLLIRVAVVMVYANHCVNVFIYAGCNADFRRAFKRILSRCGNYVVRKTGCFHEGWPKRKQRQNKSPCIINNKNLKH